MRARRSSTASRKCTGCGRLRSKEEMIRVGADGWTVTRGRVKLSGRGAYVCPARECIDRARRTGAMERTLRVKVPEGVFERVEMLSKESN
jgi:uncharacterized protein